MFSHFDTIPECDGHTDSQTSRHTTTAYTKEHYSKSLTCDDFRAIAISSILSKVFEHCIIDRYQSFLVSSDNQFGVKKGVGCSFAIRTVRSIVDYYVSKGSTVNLCVLGISEAFDWVNYYALLNKADDTIVTSKITLSV